MTPPKSSAKSQGLAEAPAADFIAQRLAEMPMFVPHRPARPEK